MSLAYRMIQSGLIWATGDAIAQGVSIVTRRESDPSYKGTADLKRVGVAAFYGGCIFTPVAGRWYNLLQLLFPQTTLSSITRRVAMDQLMWSPFALSMYFASMAVIHNGISIDSFNHLRYKLTYVLPGALVTNWLFWVPLQGLNFFFIHPSRWLLTVNLAAIPWTAYLSWKDGNS